VRQVSVLEERRRGDDLEDSGRTTTVGLGETKRGAFKCTRQRVFTTSSGGRLNAKSADGSCCRGPQGTPPPMFASVPPPPVWNPREAP